MVTVHKARAAVMVARAVTEGREDPEVNTTSYMALPVVVALATEETEVLVGSVAPAGAGATAATAAM